jgi:hypothetical protein
MTAEPTPDTPRTDALSSADFDDIFCHARQLERELALAQSRLAEVEKDAERYRWLKEIGIYIWGDTMTEFGDDELDAAIDAEITRSSASSPS